MQRTSRPMLAALAALAVTPAAIAQNYAGEAYRETARVMSSTPVYERVAQPQEQCRTELYSDPARVTSGGYVVPGGTREVQRCETIPGEAQVLRGYDVVYRYDGREFSVRLPYDPGSRLDVAVSVTPQSR